MLICRKDSSDPAERKVHAYTPYVYSEAVLGRTALACGVIRTSNGVFSPSVATYLGKNRIFTFVLGNDRTRIKWDTRYNFGDLNTTYYQSGSYYWTTRDSMPLKGFSASQIGPNSKVPIFVNPAAYSSGAYNSFNFWYENSQTNSAITPSIEYGTLATSPVSGDNPHIKTAIYTENSGLNLNLSDIVLDVDYLGIDVVFYVSLMLNLDISFTDETDYSTFYPGSSNYDISLVGGYNTKGGSYAWEPINQGDGNALENVSSKYIVMSAEYPTKYYRGYDSGYNVCHCMLSGYYSLRYPANRLLNALRIPLPGFMLGLHSAVYAPGRVYQVRGYAMNIEGVYE